MQLIFEPAANLPPNYRRLGHAEGPINPVSAVTVSHNLLASPSASDRALAALKKAACEEEAIRSLVDWRIRAVRCNTDEKDGRLHSARRMIPLEFDVFR